MILPSTDCFFFQLLQNVHSEDITGVAWGANASSLVTSSLDRTVKVFSAKK